MAKILIIGAGLGGLSSAIAAVRAGCDVEVYERAHSLSEVGAGIVLYPNALNALKRLGVYHSVVAVGGMLRTGRYLTSSGKVLVELTSDDIGEKRFSLAIHRADLQRVLADEFGVDKIQMGKRLVGAAQEGNKVIASFEDGTKAEGDALIGADGIHSAVRSVLLNDGEPRFAKCYAWRGVCTGGASPARPGNDIVPEGEGIVLFGRGKQFGAMHISRGCVYWFGAVATDSPRKHGVLREDVLDEFGDWAAPVRELVEGTANGAILCHDLYDRDPVRVWGRGNMTLLGDAAHPMTPFMGQGGCQSIEDAVELGLVLQHTVRDGVAIDAGLRAYEQIRVKRTAEFVLGSRKSQNMAMSQSAFLCGLRDAILPLIPKRILLNDLHTLAEY